MVEYLKEWESYVKENYKPEELNRCKLEELGKISDIMRDMADYWRIKMEAGLI